MRCRPGPGPYLSQMHAQMATTWGLLCFDILHVWMDLRLSGMHIELDNSKQILFIMHYTSILKRPFEMN
jgi:hypothetical protein